MRILIAICVASALLAPGAASAQFIPPGGSLLNPPLPPPPPPPKIEAPVIPQMDAPPIQQDYTPAPRPSFSDRITTCLDEAAANGLGPSARAAYSRACANQ
jgi:hypothetical protein